MTPTASLPMYNLPEMRSANAAFWEALRGLLAQGGLRDLLEALAFERPPRKRGFLRADELRTDQAIESMALGRGVTPNGAQLAPKAKRKHDAQSGATGRPLPAGLERSRRAAAISD